MFPSTQSFAMALRTVGKGQGDGSHGGTVAIVEAG